MHGSRSKIPSKNLVRQRCAVGFNSGVKGLIKRVSTIKENNSTIFMRCEMFRNYSCLFEAKCPKRLYIPAGHHVTNTPLLFKPHNHHPNMYT
jgi:hypothetical protein